MAKTLADMLSGVPNPGTGQEQIEYIEWTKLEPNPTNFYNVDKVDGLAADIALIGLQQPIVVYPSPDEAGYYRIISGHRRRAAIGLLLDEDPERWRTVPCIVKRDSVSEQMRELQVIYANSETRDLTASELSRQVERVRELLYELKEQGVEFPGRMRDHVAEACNLKKTKIATLDQIRKHLDPEIAKEYWFGGDEYGRLSTASAEELSRLPRELQKRVAEEKIMALQDRKNGLRFLYADGVKKIGAAVKQLDELSCPKGGKCYHEQKVTHIIRRLITDQYCHVPCGEVCCGECPYLERCNHVCQECRDRQRELKAATKKAKAEQEAALAERQRPYIEQLQVLWTRFGSARKAAGLSFDEYRQQAEASCYHVDRQKVDAYERGEKLTSDTTLPYGSYTSLSTMRDLSRAADVMGVSVDYLLGRTDELHGTAPVSAWHGAAERPDKPCDVVADFLLPCDNGGKPIRRTVRWDGEAFQFHGNGEKINMEPIRWMEIPDVE